MDEIMKDHNSYVIQGDHYQQIIHHLRLLQEKIAIIHAISEGTGDGGLFELKFTIKDAYNMVNNLEETIDWFSKTIAPE
jgi:hypothetical protein